MEIVLLERVPNLGQMGDVVKVRQGYARNFLLPRNKALRATKANLERFQQQKAQLEATNLERKKDAEALAPRLDGKVFVLLRQASEKGQLYGSVSARDISEAVTNQGVTINKGQVSLDVAIKTLGLHPVKVVLHADVLATITINIARSEAEAEMQAKGDAASSAPVEEENPYQEEYVEENPEA